MIPSSAVLLRRLPGFLPLHRQLTVTVYRPPDSHSAVDPKLIIGVAVGGGVLVLIVAAVLGYRAVAAPRRNRTASVAAIGVSSAVSPVKSGAQQQGGKDGAVHKPLSSRVAAEDTTLTADGAPAPETEFDDSDGADTCRWRCAHLCNLTSAVCRAA